MLMALKITVHVRLLALAIMLAMTPAAFAQTTWYVRVTGDDAADGMSCDTAFASVVKAAKVANAGDTILISGGEYVGAVVFSNNGTQANPIVVMGISGNACSGDDGDSILTGTGNSAVRLDGNYIHLQKLTITGGTSEAVRVGKSIGSEMLLCNVSASGSNIISLPAGSAEFTIASSEIHSSKVDLISVGLGTTLTIQGSELHNAGGDGIKLEGGTVTLNGTIIHDVSGNGISAPSSSDSTMTANRVHIYNVDNGVNFLAGTLTLAGCLINDTTQTGVTLGASGVTASILNCTISGTGTTGIDLAYAQATITNTIIANTGAVGLNQHQNNKHKHARANNLFWNNSPAPTGKVLGGSIVASELEADPLFTSATDFSLTAASPAVDAGIAPGPGVEPVDITGVPRPFNGVWDIGAHEFGAVTVAADLPYSTAFNNNPGLEWSDSRRNNGRYTGGVHGQFLGDPANRESTVLAVRTVPGTAYEVEFDLILAGGWDPAGATADTFFVNADAVEIFAETFDSQGAALGTYQYRATCTGQDIDGVSGIDIQHSALRATFVASTEVTRLVFRAETTDPAERFSLDNVEVRTLSPATGLVAHWKLDESAGPVLSDSSGRGLNLNVWGTLNLGIPALWDNGTQGDGFGYGIFPGPTSLNLPRGYTLSAWLKSSTENWSAFQIPVGAGYATMYTMTGTKQILSLFTDDTRRSHWIYTDLAAIDLTQWNHFASRWDPHTQELTVWVNGLQVDSLSVPGHNVYGLPSYAYASVSLMWWFNNNNNNAEGIKQDETRVYDRPLSAAEILELATLPGRFADVTEDSGFAADTTGNWEDPGSVLWGDVNNDGAPDALLTGTTTPKVMINDGAGIFTAYNLGPSRASDQIGFFDADHDGDLDLLSIGVNGLQNERVFINDGTGSFTYSSSTDFAGPMNNEGMILADVNRDGWCDAVVFSANGTWIALHSGDPDTEIFSDPSRDPIAGLNDGGDTGDGDFAASGDINNDGHLDFFYHFNGGRIFLSNGDGTYTPDAMGISIYIDNTNKAGAEFADYDNDGDLDLFIADARSSSPSTLWRNDGSSFTDVTTASGIEFNGAHRSGTWGDIDNDGDLDLYIVSANDNPNRMYLNNNDGTFTYERRDAPLYATSLDAMFADIDLDGDLDLVVTHTGEGATLLKNITDDGRSLSVRFVGAGRRRTNAAGIGMRIDLLTENGVLLARRDLGLARGYGGQSSLVAHFGGIDPATTYVVRVHLRREPGDITVVPADTSTTFAGGRTVNQMLTINESDIDTAVRVIRWQEVSANEGQ